MRRKIENFCLKVRLYSIRYYPFAVSQCHNSVLVKLQIFASETLNCYNPLYYFIVCLFVLFLKACYAVCILIAKLLINRTTMILHFAVVTATRREISNVD